LVPARPGCGQTPKSIKKKARMAHGKPYHFYPTSFVLNPGNPLILKILVPTGKEKKSPSGQPEFT
jgi:hypothetical protein